MIIGIGHRANHGKTTVAQVFRSAGFVTKSFADPVYRGAAHIAGWKNPPSTQDEKAEFKRGDWWGGSSNAWPTYGWGLKPQDGRKALEFLGTDFARSCDEDIWIALTDWQLTRDGIPKGAKGIVFDDLRFPNEADWIRSQGGIVIQVNRPSEPLRQTTPEVALEKYCNWHYTIQNDGGLQWLRWKAEELATNILNDLELL